MAKNAEAKQKPIQQLFEYAGNFKYLTIASWVLAVISAFAALVPFYFIWCLIKEVLRVAPDYGAAQNLSFYGWSAVGTAVLAMLIDLLASVCIPRAGQYALAAYASYFITSAWLYGRRGKW